MAHRKITLNEKAPLVLSMQDAAAINEVLLNVTMKEIPSARLSKACEKVRRRLKQHLSGCIC
jgi:hypothetical protein